VNIRESSYGYWSSTRAFMWVASSAAIGIGNAARLPYLMGEHGGVIYLVAYLAALLVMGLPLLVMEWSLGRWIRNDVVAGFRELAAASKANRYWALIGAVALAGAVTILSYYSVIAGWSMAYAFRAATGMFLGMNAEQASTVFLDLAQDAERGLSWHTIFMVVACVIVAHGYREGIERAALRLTPAAFAIALILCVYALARGNTTAALSFLLTPVWSHFGWRGALEAVNQAFFTLSLGIGSMLALGSYLPASAPLKRLALSVIVVDTTFSLLTGLAVFAIIFNAGLEPAGGLALIFQVFPRAAAADWLGVVITVLLFVMLFLITMASAIALLEPMTRYLMDRMRWTRMLSAVTSSIVIWYLGLGTLLSFGALSEFHLLGRNFFEWMQFLTTSLFAPGCALMMCVFVARVMPRELSHAAYGERSLYPVWLWFLRFPTRIGLIAVMLYGVGFFDWLARLWSP
jgi:NSS family neurotransmitter:Na+ symporter